MKEKKTIGFDILDNAGLDEIEKIGTDMDMLDEKTKKRILEMTRKRYNEAVKGENTGIYDSAEEIVENVEVYNRSKIRKIMTGIVNTAAVVGLAAGSVFLVKNLGGDNKPVEPDLPAVSSTIASEVDEAMEQARIRALDDALEEFQWIQELEYAYYDMNDDNVPELLVNFFDRNIPDNPQEGVFVYKYDGKDFELKQVYPLGIICADEKRIYYIDIDKRTSDEYSYITMEYLTWDNEINFTKGDTLRGFPEPIDENGFTIGYLMKYTYNDNEITEEEFNELAENFVTGTETKIDYITYYNRNNMGNSGLTQEEIARNQRIEDCILGLYDQYGIPYEDNDHIGDYAYLDVNNDGVQELFIRFALPIPDYVGIEMNYFDGTEYIPSENINDSLGPFSSMTYDGVELPACVDTAVKFDFQNRRLYQLYENVAHEKFLYIKTWENVEFSDNKDFFTLQDDYYPSNDVSYFHNDKPCTKEEYENAIAEYENCIGAELDFIPYTVKRESAEEAARNQFIEEYIDDLYNVYGKPDEDKFYDCLKIDYAYVDINNDSVDELFIRYDFLVAAADATGIGLNYFDGTKYIPFEDICITSKFDLQKCRLYELFESHQGEKSLGIRTWENVEFSDNKDFFALLNNYYSEFGDTYDDVSYFNNGEPCTKEEYEKAMDEYESCDSAELNFIPYTVKKKETAVNGQSAEEAARNQFIEEYIQHLYSEFSVTDEDKFYDCLKVDYAYLDINNDSVDELLVSYDFREVSENGYGIVLSCFDGIEYECFNSILDTSKFDLQNRKLYHLSYGTNGEKWVDTETWEEGIDFSDDNFTLQDSYYTYDGVSYFNNGEPCTKEEYEKAIAEYENCVGAELNFIPYN